MAVALCLNLVMKLASVHYVPSDALPHADVQSRPECANMCAENETCVSFVYDAGQKKCFLHGRLATEQDAVNYPVDNDVVMFNTDRDLCLVDNGYTKNMSLWVCYKYHGTFKSNHAAKSTCMQEGGDGLIRIDNPQKYQFILPSYQGDLYTAFVDGKKINGKWVYANGDPISYLPFLPGEPSGDGVCLNFWNGGLNDFPCGETRPFICEKRI